jgi:hypothetical protein
MARRKKQDEEAQENINNESDDSFGLPEVEYEPLNREEPEVVIERETIYTQPEPEPEPIKEEYIREEEIPEEPEPEYTPIAPSYTEEDDEPSVWPKVLLAIILLALVGGGAWYYFVYRPKQEQKAELAKKELEEREALEARKEADRLAALKREEDEKRRADSLATLKPAAGTIETLSERTGRYYVVIASAIDDDLIKDHANKLSKGGVTAWIIPPFGKTKFSRLAIDYKESYAEAQTAADGLKGGDYGNDIWVVKY